jgi:hypothetical protein
LSRTIKQPRMKLEIYKKINIVYSVIMNLIHEAIIITR